MRKTTRVREPQSSRSRAARNVSLALGFLAGFLCGSARAEAWHPLFNGRDLTGWHRLGGNAEYSVVGSAIIGTTVLGTPNSFLATTRQYGDFILELEFTQDAGPTNGGVQFRSESIASHLSDRVHGYQFEIDPSDRGWTGGIYDEARRGWLYPGDLNPPGKALYRPGEWNRIRLEAIGPAMRTWVNGEPVAHVVDDRTRSGFVALQVHSIRNRSASANRVTKWREIRIQVDDLRPSPPDEVFIRNLIPNDLSRAEHAQGWRSVWDSRTFKGWQVPIGNALPQTAWRIEAGELVATVSGGMQDGSAALATDESFDGFEFQADFKVGPGADGGISYGLLEYSLTDESESGPAEVGEQTRRVGALPGHASRGPMPGGLGIRPRTGEWQHARIVMRPGGHIEHWLNGIKVVDLRGIPRPVRAVPIILRVSRQQIRFRSIKVRPLRGEDPNSP